MSRNFLIALGSALITPISVHADTLYWDVNGTSAGFNTVVGAWNGTNTFWNTDATGGNGGAVRAGTTLADDLFIKQATTNTGSITLTGARQASSITFAPNVGPTTNLTGGAITIGGTGASSGIFQQSSGANTVSSALTLNSALNSFALSNTGTGNLTISGGVTGSASTGNTQTINVSSTGGTITLASSAISDGANGGKVAVVYGAPGGPLITTALSSGNTFSGGFTLNSGNINNIGAGTYGGFGTGLVTINGGRITTNTSGTATLLNNMRWNSDFTVDRAGSTPTINWDGNITLGSNITMSGSASGGNYNQVFKGNILDDTTGGRALSFTTSGIGGKQFVTLNGNNTFTGNISITQGSLTIGGAGKLGGGDYSGNINISGTSQGPITYSSSSDQILRGAISSGATGSGLVKNTNNSVLTLFGANTYTGGSTVSAGTLTFGNTAAKASSGTHTFSAGTTLGLGVGDAGFFSATDVTNAFAGTMTGSLSNVSIAATSNVGIDTTAVDFVYSDSIAGSPTKGLAKLGANKLTLTGTNTYTGQTIIRSGTLEIGSGGTTGSIAGTSGVTNNGTLTYNRSDALNADYLISGTGHVNKLGAGTLRLNHTDNTYTGITTINEGVLEVKKLAFGGASSSIGSASSSSANLVFGGPTATLRYTGSTNLTTERSFTTSSGVGGGATIESSGSGTLSFNSTVPLAYGTTNQIRTLTLGGTNTGTNSFNKAIGDNGSGALSLTKSGAGRWILSQSNTYTGATTINEGTLQIGNGGTTGSIANTSGIINNAALIYGRSNNHNVAYGISGTGSVSKSGGPGALTFTGTHSYTGATTITGGTLQLGNGGTTGSIANTSGVNNSGTLVYKRSDDVNVGYAINGTGSVSKQGAGILTMIGANGYSGLTTISEGTLQIGNGGTTGSIDNTSGVTNNAALVYNRSDDLTIGYGISGTGSVSKQGAGTLTLTNTKTYSGATNVNQGTLAVTGTGSINSSSSVTVAAGAKLDFNSSTALTTVLDLQGDGTSNRSILAGTGPINQSVTFNNIGDTISVGNSPGIMTFTPAQSWDSLSIDWEVNDWSTKVAGTNFDQISITDALALTGGVNSYMLNILSLTGGNEVGDVFNFGESNESWVILTTTGGITGFDAANWTINTAGFTNNELGTWSLTQSGNDLLLNYNLVPEPSSALLIAVAGTLGLLRRRRN